MAVEKHRAGLLWNSCISEGKVGVEKHVRRRTPQFHKGKKVVQHSMIPL